MRSPAEVIEALVSVSEDDDEGRLAYYADDAEIALLESDQVLKGLDEIREYAADHPRGERPQLRTCTIHEVGDRAVVLTTMAFNRPREDGGSYTEIRPVGSVVDVINGKIQRVVHFETWSAARNAAGLSPDSAGRRISLGRGLLMVADATRAAYERLGRRFATVG